MDRRLEVRLYGVTAGVLFLKENGNMQFRYEPEYEGPAVSVALPVRGEAYPHRDCEAWFGGLLPEGDVRDALARVLGTSSSNQFRMLNEIGGDCAGAVEIVPDDWAVPVDMDPETLSEEDLDAVIARLPQRPLGAKPSEGIRMSLAGAQPKLPAIYEPTKIGGSGFALPRHPSTPTTHLLKPEPDRYPDLVENEFFCMTLARNAGMEVALTDARKTVNGRRYLIVRRYDRTELQDGRTARIHQEDFCQALLVRSENKYQQDGGPSFRGVAESIRRNSGLPLEDVFRLWDAAVFNWAIGNCDAHAKNFSLLHDRGTPRLAPLYDLVSTVAYPELSTRWAMTIGDARFDGEVSLESWEKLALEMRLTPRAAIERARSLLAKLKRTSEEVVAIERFQTEVPLSVAGRVAAVEL